MYISVFILWLCYTAGTLFDLVRYSQCLSYDENTGTTCNQEGFRSDLNPADNYINAKGKVVNSGNVKAGNFITLILLCLNFYASGTLSILVAWLVDHRAKPNGFTRLIQWFSVCQILMDFGFFIDALSMESGFYSLISHQSTLHKPFVDAAFYVGAWILAFGDVSSVIFTTVMSYIFYKLASSSKPIDVTQYLPYGLGIAVGIASIVATTELKVCQNPTFYAPCITVYIRGSVSLVCIVLNFILSFMVTRFLKKMNEGLRKNAVSTLSSRIFYYSTWVTISRLAYIALSLGTGQLSLNFADETHQKFKNFLSTFAYLMWLPTGTGFAIIYLYTHPDEAKYAWAALTWKANVCWLPEDLHDLYYDMTDNFWYVIFCCGKYYPYSEKDEQQNTDALQNQDGNCGDGRSTNEDNQSSNSSNNHRFANSERTISDMHLSNGSFRDSCLDENNGLNISSDKKSIDSEPLALSKHLHDNDNDNSGLSSGSGGSSSSSKRYSSSHISVNTASSNSFGISSSRNKQHLSYSKRGGDAGGSGYHVMEPQSEDELMNSCNEGHDENLSNNYGISTTTATATSSPMGLELRDGVRIGTSMRISSNQVTEL